MRFPRLLRRLFIQLALLLGCLAFFPLSGHAQTGIYAAYGGSDFNGSSVGRQYGPTFGVYHDGIHLPFAGLGFDLRATLLGSGSTKAYMGFVGPHLQFHPHVVPLMPYIEGLIGGGDVTVSQGVAPVDQAALAYEGVAGVDWTILPRLDWRIAEFSIGGFSSLNASISPRTLSTGLVFRLP